jgi:hypothetical protein
MSDIPRYSANPLWFPWSFVDNPLGKFCEYRDYVKLQAENGRLRHEQKMRAIPVEAKLMDRVAELQAENERLRKAGDAMYRYVGKSPEHGIQVDKHDKSKSEWLAAKGVQS